MTDVIPSHAHAMLPMVAIDSVSVDPVILGEKIERLFLKGLDVALNFLESDIATLQLPIVKTILGAATKLLGADDTATKRELLLVADAIFTKMRELDGPATGPVTPRANHPEEESGTCEA